MTARLAVSPIPEAERAIIDNLARAYFKEVLPDGPTLYPQALDRYWSEPGRHPYVISLGGAPIGFALVWNHSDGTHELTEFSIQPEHRHQGLGTTAACLIFQSLGGDWTLGVAAHPPGNMTFWQRCLEMCEGACEIHAGPPKTPHQSGSFTFRMQS